MFRFISVVLIFVLGLVIGFWAGTTPQAEARTVLNVCSFADTSFGRFMLAQESVDRLVRNMADAVTLDRNERIYLAGKARSHIDRSRCAKALVQLDDAHSHASIDKPRTP